VGYSLLPPKFGLAVTAQTSNPAVSPRLVGRVSDEQRRAILAIKTA
jgi:hypothetical protein